MLRSRRVPAEGGVLVGDEDPCTVDLLGGEGVDGAFVAVAGAVVVVDDVAVGGEDGDVAGKKAYTVNAAFETAVACPCREDLVSGLGRV